MLWSENHLRIPIGCLGLARRVDKITDKTFGCEDQKTLTYVAEASKALATNHDLENKSVLDCFCLFSYFCYVSTVYFLIKA